MIRIRTLLLILSCAAILVGCGKSHRETRPTLTVSIEPLRFMVEAVAGDRFDVVTLVPTGASPETYEPTPRQLVSMDRSRAYFRVGTLGFERTRLEKIQENAPNALLVNASEGISLLPDTDGCNAVSGDPHTWTSPANARIMARNIWQALCRIDSASTDYYTARLQRLEQRIDSVDGVMRKVLQPLSHRTFVIHHPALGYLARDYGLKQLAVEHDGKEPSAARLRQLAAICRTDSVSVVFIQREHAGRASRRLAEEIGAHVVEINPLGYDWVGCMMQIAKALGHE